jgi:hypothetical protein
MLSRFDDYPIHQTPEPIAHRASSDPNAYDRSWFNGVDREARFVALGLYPHQQVMDAHFSIPSHQHLHNLVRAKVGEKLGVGLLEQILLGPHAGYGFSGLVDGAPAPGLLDGARA